MNDKDKEAFEDWFHQLTDSHLDRVIKLNRGASQKAWQAACEYKQKEIEELEKEKDYLCKKMENMREIYKNSEKLQAENAKLRECVMFYAELTPVNLGLGYQAKQCLKELGY